MHDAILELQHAGESGFLVPQHAIGDEQRELRRALREQVAPLDLAGVGITTGHDEADALLDGEDRLHGLRQAIRTEVADALEELLGRVTCLRGIERERRQMGAERSDDRDCGRERHA